MKLALAALLIVCACGHKAAPTPAAPEPAAKAVTGTLTGLKAGDRACYVEVKTEAGEDASMEGDFELCEGGGKDATALIGQKVTWTTEKSKIQAMSCQGDPDCADSDEVDLVVSISPAAP